MLIRALLALLLLIGPAHAILGGGAGGGGTLGAAGTTAITINEVFVPQAAGVQSVGVPVVQRIAGTNAANMTFSGTYTGTPPASVWIKIVDAATHNTSVQAYTQCPSPTIAGGTWTGCTISVPTYAGWEAGIAGVGSGSPSVTSSPTANNWGVGSNFLYIGDSVSEKFFFQPNAGSPASNALTMVWCPSVAANGICPNVTVIGGPWQGTASGNASAGMRAFLATVQPGFNWPVAIVGTGQGSTCLLPSTNCSSLDWTTTAHSTWQAAVGIVAGSGQTDFEGVIFYGFGADSRVASPPSLATTVAGFQTLYSHLLSAFTANGRTAANFPLFVGQIGPETATSSFDAGFNAERAFAQQCPTQLAGPTYNCVLVDTGVDLPPGGDGIHPLPSSYEQLGFRDGQTVCNYYSLGCGSGSGTYPGSGPFPTTCAISGSTLVLTTTLNGPTGLVNASGSTTAGTLTGLTVTDGGGATVTGYSFTQPNKVVLTLNQAPSGGTTVANMQGEDPNAGNNVYGNAAPGASAVNLPLLPTLGATSCM